MSDEEIRPEPSRKINPLRRALRKAIRTAQKRAERKRAALEAEGDECHNATVWLEMGEIIKANLGAIQRGEISIELPDLYHPGQTRIQNQTTRPARIKCAKKRACRCEGLLFETHRPE